MAICNVFWLIYIFIQLSRVGVVHIILVSVPVVVVSIGLYSHPNICFIWFKLMGGASILALFVVRFPVLSQPVFVLRIE